MPDKKQGFIKDHWEIIFPLLYTVILTVIMAIAAHFMN